MPKHRRLYRKPIRDQLAKIARHWNKLTFPRFCIQAENERNPDRLADPDKNQSKAELVEGFIRGHLGKIPVDSRGRPDSVIMAFANSALRRWNRRPENHTTQLYSIPYTQREIIPATKRKPQFEIDVIHDYLQTLRGKDSVRNVDRRFHSGIAGMETSSKIIQNCVNTKAVDEQLERVLQENQRIQDGVT